MTNFFTRRFHNHSNPWRTLQKTLATKLAIPFARKSGTVQSQNRMNLLTSHGRKYLNQTERRLFVAAAKNAPTPIKLFCLVLALSGCRISEALALRPHSFDLDGGTVIIETLKRRKKDVMRQVPLPAELLLELEQV